MSSIVLCSQATVSLLGGSVFTFQMDGNNAFFPCEEDTPRSPDKLARLPSVKGLCMCKTPGGRTACHRVTWGDCPCGGSWMPSQTCRIQSWMGAREDARLTSSLGDPRECRRGTTTGLVSGDEINPLHSPGVTKHTSKFPSKQTLGMGLYRKPSVM